MRPAPLAGLVPAAVLTLVLALLTACGAGAGTQDRAAQPETPGASADAGATILSAPAAADGTRRCAVPTPEALREAAVAVAATVTSVDDERVVLDPSQWYVGEPTERMVVRAVPERLQGLALAMELREGEQYLLAATASREVMLCGFSGPRSPRLLRLYGGAFGS